MERAKWRSPIDNHFTLDLGNGIGAEAVLPKGGRWKSRALGRDVGTFPELKDAQKAAENALRMALREALTRMGV